MKQKKKNLLNRCIGFALCMTMMITAVPILALETSENPPMPDTEIILPVEKYPFVLEYTSSDKKDTLLKKLTEWDCEPELMLDFANCVSVKLTMEQLSAIKEYEYIQSVEENYEYKLLSEQQDIDKEALRKMLAGNPPVKETSNETAPIQKEETAQILGEQTQQIERPQPFKNAHDKNIKGQNIKVAILDTGIAAHPDFTIAGGISFVGDKDDYTDTNGHGTQMAGIISALGENNPNVKGAAPLAQLYAVKIVDENGFATTATIMAGINWAVENDIHIINMSFGSYFESKLLERTVKCAAEAGVIMVGAVGNDGMFDDEYRIMYPAAYDNVLAVGAGSGYGTASFSNKNIKLDFVAPGRLDSTNINGEYTHIVGTSASTAYTTGILATLWSAKSQHKAEEILKTVKKAGFISDEQKDYIGFGEINLDDALTNFDNYAKIEISKEEKYNSATYTNVVEWEKSLAPSTENMPMAMAAGNCFANQMASAKSIGFFSTQTGRINCPGNEVWYCFTANYRDAHPKGSKTRYFIDTTGKLDTVLYLYDSSGNQIDYNDDYNGHTTSLICPYVNYNEKYYIRVKAYGSNTGSYGVVVRPNSDEYGDTFSTAYDGEKIWGTYYADKSISGYLAHNDIDIFKFVPARDCVMEIYTEGSTDTYGTLYNECKSYITSNDDGNGNGNFEISYHFKGMQWYYIAVRHSSSSCGNYTLRFRFVKDYCYKPNLGSSTNPNYANLRTYINWTPTDPPYTIHTIGYVGLMPVYETETYIGRVWMNWSTAEHWNLHVIDNTENNANNIMSTLGKYAAETVTTQVLTEIVCSTFSLSATAEGPVGVVLGSIVSLFSSAIDSDAKDPETQKFQNYARSIINDNTKWIRGECINHTLGGIISDPMYVDGTNKITYEMENNSYFYGVSLLRGTYSTKFAKAQ